MALGVPPVATIGVVDEASAPVMTMAARFPAFSPKLMRSRPIASRSTTSNPVRSSTLGPARK